MNKNFILVLLMLSLFCGCVSSIEIKKKGLSKVSVPVHMSDDRKKRTQTIYFRNNKKILLIEKSYYKGKPDGAISQKIISNNQVLLEILKCKHGSTYTTFPNNTEYSVVIAYDDGNLGAISIMKNFEYIEIYKRMNDGIIMPIPDSELEKAIEVSKSFMNAFPFPVGIQRVVE